MRDVAAYYAQSSSVGDGGGEFSVADPLHAALDDGHWEVVLARALQKSRTVIRCTSDAEPAGELCVERHFTGVDCRLEREV